MNFVIVETAKLLKAGNGKTVLRRRRPGKPQTLTDMFHDKAEKSRSFRKYFWQ